MLRDYMLNKISKVEKLENEIIAISNMINYYLPTIEKKLLSALVAYGIDLEDYNKYFATNIPVTKTTESEPITVTLDTDINTCTDDDYTKILSLLYKHVALRTHPDKQDGKQDGKQDDFILINKMYNDKDVYSLIVYCDKHKMATEEILDINVNLSTLIVEKKISSLRKKLIDIKAGIQYKLIVDEDIIFYLKCVADIIKLKKENEAERIKCNELKEKLSKKGK